VTIAYLHTANTQESADIGN